MLIVDENLKMTTIDKMTVDSLKKIKVSEVEKLAGAIPDNYKKAIASLLKDIFTFPDGEEKNDKYTLLGQMFEQVAFINRKEQIMESLK